jgi:putative DNA primase/helicase
LSFIHAIATEINSKFEYKVTPEKINIEGEFTRWGDKDHCWGVGKKWTFKGVDYWQYFYGSWKDGVKLIAQSWSEKEVKEASFYKRLKDETAVINFRISELKHEKNEECKKAWLPIYENANREFGHAYLDRKKIGKFNARLSNGQLLIPIYDELGFVGVQRIWADGIKRFSAGIKIKGSFSYLKEFVKEPLIFLCEGFATAATIQEAFPDIPVLIAFSCHNIPEAIETIRFLSPLTKIVIAADRDESGQGEKWARISQKRYTNVIYRLPKFEIKSKELSDFNDLANLYGSERVKECLEIDESEFSTITALGYNGASYFYRSSENLEIVEIKAREHDRKSFMRLISDLRYWVKRFGIEDENGKIKVLWDKAHSELSSECHKKGMFDFEMTRGVGIWRDQGQIVINDGSKNNAPKNADYIYLGARKRNLDLIPYLDNPIQGLWENGFSKLGSKNKQSNIYLAAWFVQAYIFPLMDWRFNIWLRGPAGLGKTQILSNLKKMIILSDFSTSATAAGIRQKHKSNQVAFCFDESEAENPKAMDDLLSLARQCSANKSGSIIRGTPSGSAVQSNPQVLFALGSTQDSVVNAADRSRWLFIDVQKVPLEEWKAIESCFEKYSERKNEIFSYIFDQFETIQATIKMAKDVLNERGQEARISDQLSAVIGCMSIYFMTNKQASESDNMRYIINHIIDYHELLNSDYTEDNKVKESENALDSLAGLVLDQKSLRTVHDMIYGEIYFQLNRDSESKSNSPYTDCAQMLSAIGLRVFPGQALYGTHEIFVSTKNDLRTKLLPRYPKLAQVLKDGKYISKAADVQAVAKGSAVSRGIRVYYDIKPDQK